MATYLIVGPPGNLKIGIDGNIWGLPSTAEKSWQQLVAGDTVVFYATAPVKGVVGYAQVDSTMRDTSLLWPQEKQQGRAQWPLRIILRDIRAVPSPQWVFRRISVDRRGGLTLQRSFLRLPEDRAMKLVQGIDAELNQS